MQIVKEITCGGPATGGIYWRPEMNYSAGAPRRVGLDRATDHKLVSAMRGLYGQAEDERIAAAIEWRRRYPTPESGTGWKSWKATGDRVAAEVMVELQHRADARARQSRAARRAALRVVTRGVRVVRGSR